MLLILKICIVFDSIWPYFKTIFKKFIARVRYFTKYVYSTINKHALTGFIFFRAYHVNSSLILSNILFSLLAHQHGLLLPSAWSLGKMLQMFISGNVFRSMFRISSVLNSFPAIFLKTISKRSWFVVMFSSWDRLIRKSLYMSHWRGICPIFPWWCGNAITCVSIATHSKTESH